MKTSSVAFKSQDSHTLEKNTSLNCQSTDTEEPPGKSLITSNIEEEPPSCTTNGRYRFFWDVSDASWKDWKWQFRNRITSLEQLIQLLPLSVEEQAQIQTAAKRYPLSITPYYLSLINPSDPNDPIKKQSVPCIQEITMSSFGMEDPLAEKEDSVVPGLVHRYPDRALMVLTDICPMLCRHCTRKREWRHGAWTRTDDQIEAMLDYLRQHTAIRDVILSGGDPLTLSTSHLETIIAKIREIKHIEIIRIGSRFPVVLPQRIDDELCNMLSKYGPIWFNTHFNHPREVTPEAAAACDKLIRAGVPVNNQTVLLRGINDSVEIQTKLAHALLKAKVRPYYLFQCDEVQGTEHLRTSVDVGIKIIEGMRGHTSGLAIPNFVVDLVEGGGKVPLNPNYVLSMNDSELLLQNYEGKVYRYRNPKTRNRKEEAVAAPPVSGVVESLLEDAALPVKTKGEAHADRVIVRP
ncbi:MAG: KamA family radical SAM protein [Dehalococcoidales bacterium]|nr:KamA family radical SAM protein [Dehalococcoidales bacterium]